MCLHPLTIKNEDQGFITQVSCGQCYQCKNRRRWQWIGRMVLERQCHVHARFLTLTYSEDPGVLDPGHLSDFLKRYRYHYGSCRYFAVGEYGEKNGRGHYHAVIFGHAPQAIGRAKITGWDAGYAYDGNATLASMSYVGGYVMKTGDAKTHRPFVRMSLKPGLGFTRIDLMGSASPKNLVSWPTGYYVGGKRYPLCEGGLARFKVSYLEHGGLPPASSNPEELTARWWVADQPGTRVQTREAAYIDHMKRFDDHGLQSR